MVLLTFSDSVGNSLEGIISIPKKAKSVVVMSHGFSSSKASNFYEELEEELNNLKIGTFRYDYYGHGPMYGYMRYGNSRDVTLSKTVESLKAAISTVRTRGYDIGLLGSSGGCLVTLVGASLDQNIKALALKSPVAEPKIFWEEKLGKEKIKKWKAEGTMHQDSLGDFWLDYGFWEDLQKYDTLKDAKRISCPSLIVHGEKDTSVPIKQSYNLARALSINVTIVKGADHSYSNREHYLQMKKSLVDFFKAKL